LVREFGHQSIATTEPCPELPPLAEIADPADRPAAVRAPATRSAARVFFIMMLLLSERLM